MPTSQNQSVLSEIHGETPISIKTREYFRRLLQNRLHALVLQAFIDQEAAEGLTQKQLAGRLEKGQDQISRWLHTAGNWTFDTLSDLLLGMKVRLDDPSYTSFDKLVRRSKARASYSSTARSAKRLNNSELLVTMQIELALEARQSSGANMDTTMVKQGAGISFDPAKKLQDQTLGVKIASTPRTTLHLTRIV